MLVLPTLIPLAALVILAVLLVRSTTAATLAIAGAVAAAGPATTIIVVVVAALAVIVLLTGTIRQLDVLEPAALSTTLLVPVLRTTAARAALLVAALPLLATTLLTALAAVILLAAILLIPILLIAVLLATALLATILLATILLALRGGLCALVLRLAGSSVARQLDAQIGSCFVRSGGGLATAAGARPAAGALLCPIVVGLAPSALRSLLGGRLALLGSGLRRSSLCGGTLCGSLSSRHRSSIRRRRGGGLCRRGRCCRRRSTPADRVDQLALAQSTGALDAALGRHGLQFGKLLRRKICAGSGVVHPGSFLSSRSRRLCSGLDAAQRRELSGFGWCSDWSEQGSSPRCKASVGGLPVWFWVRQRRCTDLRGTS